MPDQHDPLDDAWLRQRLAATLGDAGRIPRRRLPFPSAAADRDRQARRSGFLAGALTTALVLGIAWAGVTLGTQRSTHGGGGASTPPTSTPSPSAGRAVSTTVLPAGAAVLAAGAGAVWVPDDPAGTLLRVDAATGRITAGIDAGVGHDTGSGTFAGVVATPAAVWLASATTDELIGIDPAADRVMVRVPLGTTPSSLAADGDSVWVSSNRGGTVLRITAAGAASRVSARIAVPRPGPIAAGAGRVWVVSQSDGILWRIDPAGNTPARVLAPPPALDYVVGAVAASADGAWFRNLAAQSVEHVEARSGSIVDRVPLGAAQTLGIQNPFSIAVAPKAVWVTVTNALLRVDVATTTVSTVPMVRPTGVAVAADGSVWVVTDEARLIHVVPAAR